MTARLPATLAPPLAASTAAPTATPLGRPPRRAAATARRPAASLVTTRRLMLAVVVACLVSLAATTYNNARFGAVQAEAARLEEQVEGARRLTLAMADAEGASRGFLLFGAPAFAEQFQRAAAFLESPAGRRIAEAIDAADAAAGGSLRAATLPEHIEDSLRQRRLRMHLHARGETEEARRGSADLRLLRVAGETRDMIDGFTRTAEARLDRLKRSMAGLQDVVFALVAISGLLAFAALGLAWASLSRRTAAAAAAQEALAERGREMAALLRLSEVLQACQTSADLEQVVSHGAAQIVPGSAGALYVFNNSRDRMDLAAHWHGAGLAEVPPSAPGFDHLAAEDCWALKRGRPHACGEGGLVCRGTDCAAGRLCIPMAARGEVYGVLQFEGLGETEDSRLANALADGVTLALANQSLREKLRGQALRDALTGLHNRRFLEEAGERLAAQCERRGTSLSVAMLDLDHFKQVNDRLGHAAGDAALRAVAQDLLSDMRQGDLACRFGGEELLLVMPDCDTAGALGRVERLRERIAAARGLGVPGLSSLTFSAGVASMPDSATGLAEAIRAADAALYAAKQAGRNRVMAAPLLLQPVPETVPVPETAAA